MFQNPLEAKGMGTWEAISYCLERKIGGNLLTIKCIKGTYMQKDT